MFGVPAANQGENSHMEGRCSCFYFLLVSFCIFLFKGKKKKKHLKWVWPVRLSEAFCGSLQNEGFVPFESPHDPCCLCTVCETSLGFKQTWGWPLRQSHCHSLEETYFVQYIPSNKQALLFSVLQTFQRRDSVSSPYKHLCRESHVADWQCVRW